MEYNNKIYNVDTLFRLQRLLGLMTIEKLNMTSYNVKCLLVLNLGRLSNNNAWKFCISSLLQRDELINLVEPNSNNDFKTKDKKIVNNFKH